MDALHQAGAEVVALPLPATWDGVHAHHRRIMAVEAAEYHRRWFPAQRAAYAPRIAELLEEGRAASALDYAAALQHKALFRRDMVQALSDVDALVTPATVTTAPPRDTTGDPYFNSPWSYCGLPTISIPCGLADDGLPLSLQLAGPPLKEAALLAVAQWCEDVLKFDKLPPILGA
jgi:aspartyl-tRNA(Asn)/glutamyl-tRNA(Gln) amidotransferase subunit A